jgi:NTE family protein
VLGAGGVAGGAWHAGVLAALEERGWDARAADLVVGTSAGAGTAAALRLGIPPGDLLAGATGGPMSPAGEAYASRSQAPAGIPAPVLGGRIPMPAAPMLALRSLARPWDLRPVKTMAGLLPVGRVPTDFIGERIRRSHEGPWPDEPTWICAVRLSDGERVVFGRDVDDAHLATAVEASSAVPGYFAPRSHGGVTYVDGGVHSPTNADLVAGLGFDIVVVSSPMSATRSALRRPAWTGSRALHSATLRREVRQIRSAGTPVLVLQPGPDVVDAVGLDSMDVSRRARVAEVAHDTVRRHLRSARIADRLGLLGGG